MSKADKHKKKAAAKAADLPYRPGVGAVLFNADGRVLVARRNDVAGAAWQFPQGGIRKDEDPEGAVIRELREEIGTDRVEIIGAVDGWLTYDLPADLLGKAWRGRYRGQKQKWFALRFLGDDADIDLDGDGHAEFDDWKWVDLEAVPAMIVPFKRAVYEQVVAGLMAMPALQDRAVPGGGGGAPGAA